MLRAVLMACAIGAALAPAVARGAPVLVSGAGADGDSHPVAVSADGRLVAFNSEAGNLSQEDPPPGGRYSHGPMTGYVRDVRTGALTLAGRQSDADGGAAADDQVWITDMSADGRFVVLTSYADNLSPADVDAPPGSPGAELDHDVFLRDLATGTTTLVGPGGQGGRVSDDGRVVAFTTVEALVPADRDRAVDVYVTEPGSGGPVLASPRTSNRYGTNDALGHALSGNGRYVTYTSRPWFRGDEERYAVTVRRYDLRRRRGTVVHRQQQWSNLSRVYETAVSADGRVVAFMAIWRYAPEDAFEDTPAGRKVGPVGVFRWREESRRARRISVSRCGEGLARTTAGDIDLSADGRRVAWVTLPVPPPSLRIDVVAGPIGRCGSVSLGRAADGPFGSTPALSADGRWIAYASSEPALSDADGDEHADVFLDRLP
ncbi:MAG TPA: hypothetical protein VHF89_12190 [Solirubrobacteraceae bacterium]|nr:hypothetical protein [Solirubrobacteraceae bacterium]